MKIDIYICYNCISKKYTFDITGNSMFNIILVCI